MYAKIFYHHVIDPILMMKQISKNCLLPYIFRVTDFNKQTKNHKYNFILVIWAQNLQYVIMFRHMEA